MSHDEVLHRFRVALFARAQQVGVSRACREFGVHRSTYDRWLPAVLQWALNALRPRERRRPQMANHTLPWVEQRVVAFALRFPGWGRSGSPPSSPVSNGVARCSPRTGSGGSLRRNGLSTRRQRLTRVAGTAVPPGPERPVQEEARHLEAAQPGDMVQQHRPRQQRPLHHRPYPRRHRLSREARSARFRLAGDYCTGQRTPGARPCSTTRTLPLPSVAWSEPRGLGHLALMRTSRASAGLIPHRSI